MEPDEDPGKLVVAFNRGDRDDPEAKQLQLRLKQFKGHHFLELRLWNREGDGYVPTRSFMTIRSAEAKSIGQRILDFSAWQEKGKAKSE